MGREALLSNERCENSWQREVGNRFHLEPEQVNLLIGVGSFALGVVAAREKAALSALKSLPELTLIDMSAARAIKASKLVGRLESLETSYPHGQFTIENARGQKWLHQEGYSRVPIHKAGATWWHDSDQNLTWVKTSHYLESRGNDGSFFRSYKNGGIQIRFGNGYEFYESNLPERRKIVLSSGVSRN